MPSSSESGAAIGQALIPIPGVGAALGGLVGGLFGGSNKPSLRQRQTNWALRRARNLAERPYTRYSGERIAPLGDMEERGMRLASESVGNWRPYMDRAASLADRSNRQIEGYDLSGYMNPYREAVLDVGARKLAERGAMAKNSLKRSAVSRNAFGGSRATLLEAAQDRDLEQNIGDMYTEGMDAAWRDATGNFFRDNATAQAGFGNYMNLARGESAMSGEDIRRLYEGGALERGVRQAENDVNYADFLEERDWDVGNLSILLNALGISSAVPEPGNPALGALGGAISGAQLGSILFPSNNGQTPPIMPNPSGMYGSGPISVAGGTFDASQLPSDWNPYG